MGCKTLSPRFGFGMVNSNDILDVLRGCCFSCAAASSICSSCRLEFSCSDRARPREKLKSFFADTEVWLGLL